MENKAQILQKIEQIFRNELNDDSLQISFDSSSNSIEKWDSINNLILLNAIEEQFNISFPIEVIFHARHISDLIDYIVANTKS